MVRHTTRTTQSYLAGIGVGGALLACALVAFLSLIGAVSVSVWPEPGAPNTPEVVELQAPAQPELAEAEGLFASAEVLVGGLVGTGDGAGAPDAGTPDGAEGPQGPGGPSSPPDVGAVPPEGDEPEAVEQPGDDSQGRDTEVGQDDLQGKGHDFGDVVLALATGDGDADGHDLIDPSDDSRSGRGRGDASPPAFDEMSNEVLNQSHGD